MEKRLKPPLEEAVRFLEGAGYQYAIIGGVALASWGVVRATYDLDIKVWVTDTDYAKARTAIRSAFPEAARPHAPNNPLIVAVTIQSVVVDFLLTLPGYEEQIIHRADRRDLDGMSVWICTAEDLIIQKVVAGRGKDWLDVEELLIEQGGKLDVDYIEHWLEQFVAALEDSELLEKYHAVVERVDALR